MRRCLAFGYVARCCSRRNARLSCGADNGGRNTSPHTISPFTPFNSVLLRSGAFRFLKPDCVAWLLSNNRKRLLYSSFEVLQQPRSPRAPLTLSRKAKNFFIYFHLPLSGTEPFKKISQKLGQYYYFCRSLKVRGVKVDLSCFLDAGSTVMYFHFEKPKSWWRKFWSQWCLSCHESGIPSRIHTQSSLMI